MLARRTGHGQHVVERHGDVRHDDLPGGLGEGLARRAAGDGAVGVDVLSGDGFNAFFLGVSVAQFAPHLPADPEQKDAADQDQAEDLQKLGGDAGKADAQHGGRDDADEDRLVALVLGKAGRSQANDDGVVARQHEIDHDDLAERPKGIRRQQRLHEF